MVMLIKIVMTVQSGSQVVEGVSSGVKEPRFESWLCHLRPTKKNHKNLPIIFVSYTPNSEMQIKWIS